MARRQADTEPTVQEIARIVHEAAATRTRRLVLVTGVPGAGKTLVGLSAVLADYLADLALERADGKPTVAVFLSGNGPLVQVLQYELKKAGGGGKTFVRGVKDYVKTYSRKNHMVPPEHVLVFDEAQRAWDEDKVASKHEGGSARSEPEHFIEFAERIPGWCVVIGLIGIGQEIHDGEEGGLCSGGGPSSAPIRRLRARAHGKPGHASIPHSENPVFFLAQALEKLRRAGHLPVHLSPTFLKMMDAAGAQIRSTLGSLTKLLHSPALMGILLNRMKGDGGNILRALVTNTISPTLLHAGSKVNVIPSVAEADIDCRLVPGQTPEDVQREIHDIVGEGIELETIYTTSGAEFSTETQLFKVLERRTRQMDPSGVTNPMLMTGATEACQPEKRPLRPQA